jgi:GxxExxY protein
VHNAASLNRLTSTIIATSIEIHRSSGPGLLEAAYLACLGHELKVNGLRLDTQRALPLVFHDLRLECAYRADLIVEDAVLVEVKALETVARVHKRQLNTYVHLADCRVGLLLNSALRRCGPASYGS